MRDRLRPAVLARKVLLPPVLAGAAVSCLLAGLALTIASGSRAGGPNPLARAATTGEPLAIGLSLELVAADRLRGVRERGLTGVAWPSGERGSTGVAWPARDRASAVVIRLAASPPEPSTLALPVAGTVGGCGTFGCPRPGHLHNGVDFLAAAGTPVHAAASGRVALVQSSAQSSGYGNFVCLQHRPALATCYAHLSAVAARVRAGASVERGQVVGLVGATGSASTPHLHFEVRRGPAACQQCAVDPLALLQRRDGRTLAQAEASDAPTAATAPRRPAAVAPAPPAVAAPPLPPPPPGGDTSPPDDTTTFVQAKPARPQEIHLPPEPAPEPKPKPEPKPEPQPAPVPAAPSGPVSGADSGAAAPVPAVPAGPPPG